jgi:EmrB/QacA subfamily drug resistance transporter
MLVRSVLVGKGRTVPETQYPQELHGRKLTIVFMGLMLVTLIAALDATIVATALPTIAGDLGGLDHIAWVTTAYILAETVVTPLYGKLGDLYGRRLVMLIALVVFVAGSALCGFSQNFAMLIVFRAVQGLGGGGLMVSAQAAIGDVVSPRARGRYQGAFGAVFGVATVIGPLLGGWLTTTLSWRWIFYINLPVGVAAFAVIALTFPKISTHSQHKIDYLGTALLAAALSALVLMVTLGGTSYPWASGQILALAATVVVALVAFVFVERKAAEPIIPLHLFQNQVFVTTGIVAMLVGFAMFGAITFLPLYFQVVKDSSPTESGLQLLPLMAGLLLTSIAGGFIVSRTGKYRVFPILGTAVMTVGLFLLTRLAPATSTFMAAVYMFVTGLGIGLVMQILVVAVQNAVGYEDLGVATSGNTLLRNIGASVGTAAIGTIFASQLASRLADAFPTAPPGSLSTSTLNGDAIAKLPEDIQSGVLKAFSGALDRAFLIAGFVSIVAFIAAWFIKELPMRTTVAANDLSNAFGVPRAPDSLAEVIRSLSVLIGRPRMADWLQRIADEEGVNLPLSDCWILVQVYRYPDVDLNALAIQNRISASALEAAATDLVEKGYLTGGSAREITPAGEELAVRILAAVRARLAKLLDGWDPEKYSEVAHTLDLFASEFSPDRAEFEQRAPALLP